jgi:exonuclease SbcC
MRILAIRGCNLASLAGEFEIDLAHGPLGGAGVFAIVGPTGAGKSTLLDAMCVALFHQTPRLNNHSRVVVGHDPEDTSALGAQDARAMLRRGASAGYAEVDFESGDAKKYRARWSVRRARGATDGRYQDPQVSLIALDPGGERLGGTRTETLKAIHERLGLTFDQFRRSALLAQGEFAAFLRADGKDRSELLERMTGTEIYSRLSVAAHVRAQVAAQRLRDLGSGAAAIAVLADDARAAMDGELATARSAREAARIRLAAAELAARWVAEAERRERELAAAIEACARAEAAIAAADGVRDELALRRRAEELRGAWQDAERLARQVAIARGELAAADAAIEAHARGRAELDGKHARAKQDHAQASERVETARRDAGKLDKPVASLDAAGKRERAARIAHRDAEKLVTIASEAKGAATARETLAFQLAELDTARDVDGELQAIVELERELASAARDDRERALTELRRVAGYAHARAELVDGEPCPLCGAPEHPWKDRGAIDVLIAGAEAHVADAKRARDRAIADLAQLAARDGQRERERTRLHAHVATVDETTATCATRWRALLAELGELPLVTDPALEPARALAAERVAGAATKLEQAIAARAEAEAVATAMRDAQAQLLARQTEAARRGDELRAIDGKIAAHIAADERLAGDRAAKYARAHELGGEAADAAARLDTARIAAGFELDSLRRLLSAEPGRADALAQQLADLDRAGDRARTLVGERRRLVTDHAATRPSRPAAAASSLDESAPMEPLDDAARVPELAAAVHAADARAAALAAALAADDDARARRAAALAQLASAEQGAEIDRVLGEVIGSHDGKLFRSFAQSLTLDGLLAVANSHLEELAPRYQLERVPKHDLELQVIDRELGGDVRSVQSLSGGESFLVSLALALGLSSMSAHDVRVRTLLIDEGFGTLDPATLDSALAVLDALQATGRQVGVISHVPALVERVGAHVRVSPRGGGKSDVIVADMA